MNTFHSKYFATRENISVACDEDPVVQCDGPAAQARQGESSRGDVSPGPAQVCRDLGGAQMEGVVIATSCR